MNKVYYVGYYDTPDSKQQRVWFPSATNFMDYISDKICANGYDVEIVSMSDSKAQKIEHGLHRQLGNKKYLKLFLSFGKKNNLLRRLDIHFLRFQMFIYLFTHVKKNDVVIVYHSLNYVRVLTWLKKIKHYKCISHFCEVYSEVSNDLPKKLIDHEFDLINMSDAYIFSNYYLQQTYNTKHLNYTIIHGIYKPFSYEKCEKFDDGKIHVVYAGTLDSRKGGAAAAAAAAFLDERYHVHILGFGSEEQITQIKEQIDKSKQSSQAEITYDGLLSGKEFTDFLSKCHIGLATQIPDASFCKSSFPSKVLTYLACGLEVVSSRYEAVEHSDVGGCLHYYDGQAPQDIAKCIMETKPNGKSIEKLLELDNRFGLEIDRLITDLMKR